jgi:hypothetical protein
MNIGRCHRSIIEASLKTSTIDGHQSSSTPISLGSGPAHHVMFLLNSDTCGENPGTPRHARAYGDLAALYEQIADERVKALGNPARSFI